MNDSRYNCSPVLCIDSRDRCRAAWISCDIDGEFVYTSLVSDTGSFIEPIKISNSCDGISGIAIASFREKIAVVWVEEGLRGGLYCKFFEEYPNNEPSILLVPGLSVPTHPAVYADYSMLVLVWSVRNGHNRHIEGIILNDISLTINKRQIFTISNEHSSAAYPKAAIKNGIIGIVWQEMTHSISSICFRLLSQEGMQQIQTIVSDEECSVAVPAIASSPIGFWLAWQSDRDLNTGPELVRDVELIHIDENGKRTQPSEQLKRIKRRGYEEDQGFEFPILISADDGHLIVIGRGSQSCRRIDLGASGQSDFVQIDRSGWGCRPKRFSAATSSAYLWFAFREKNKIKIEKLPLSLTVQGMPLLDEVLEQQTFFPKSSVVKSRNLIFGGCRVLFGDIHQHTAASDGTGTFEETFFRAKTRYEDQVVAITDHESFLGKRTFIGEWRDYCRVVDEYYEPGAFVTLKGFEWTGKMYPGPGHKAVYFATDECHLMSRDDPKTSSSAGLLRECRHHSALAFPHHVGWTGADMENHCPETQTCWEIISCHGAYERLDDNQIITTRGDDKEGQFIADALDKNLRFGFVGGSDGHGLSFHHGISRKQDSHRTGLTGFLSRDVTREGVIDALKKRRCFATSGAKIALWFEVDGCPMGEEILTGSEVPFRISAVGTSQIIKLSLVSNGGIETHFEVNDASVNIQGILPPPPINGFAYYFVRLIQEDNEIAWSSPIWLDHPCSA